MNNARVKAFTIMEVTVSMLITGIVIVMSYTVYSIVVKTYYSYNKKNSEHATLLRVDELLRNDFRQAEIIISKQNHIIMKRGETRVDYSFDSTCIIRSSVIADTFKVHVTNLKKSFEDNLINEEAEQQTIDELALMLIYNNKTFPYHYRKQYSALNLITATQ